MTIKDVLIMSASMLGREDVVDYLNGKLQDVGEDTEPTVNLLVNLLNLVISELSATFIPMIKTEKVAISSGKIFYSNLKENAIRIIKVYDNNGNEMSIKQTAEYIAVSGTSATVEYEYSPANYGLSDVIGYTPKEVGVSTLAYGLNAEYSISRGNFEEAVMWHRRYVDSVSELRKVKNVTIKERSFV